MRRFQTFPPLNPERGGSTLSGSFGPAYEIEALQRAGTERGKQHRRHKREEYPTPLPRGPHVHGNPLSATLLQICDKPVGSYIRGPTYCRGAPTVMLSGMR